jgi:hypothetical protein
MRTKTLGLLMAPLFLLGTACDERTATAPEDASFARNNTESNYAPLSWTAGTATRGRSTTLASRSGRLGRA